MPKTYRVVSEAAYKGHAHGETFTADLRPDEEARAVARGAILVEEDVIVVGDFTEGVRITSNTIVDDTAAIQNAIDKAKKSRDAD